MTETLGKRESIICACVPMIKKKKVLSEMIPLLLSDCAKMLANEKKKNGSQLYCQISKYYLGTMANRSWLSNKCRGRASSNLLFNMFDQI